jgi:superfamily I DNA and/or RNA helicase
MAIRRNRVTANQIAVITPYRRQVQRIKTLLNAKGYASVQVGMCLVISQRPSQLVPASAT